MKRKRLIPISILILVFLMAQVQSVQAHPADVYTQSIHVTLDQKGILIQWEFKPGPMLISSIWFNADTNQDNAISPEEANDWASSRVSEFSSTLNGAPFSLHFDGVQFPSSEDAFQSGQEFITMQLSAPWPGPLKDSFQLTFHNGVEEQKSLNWYFINSNDGLVFQTPQQKNSNILLKIFQSSSQSADQEQLITTWDTSMPTLSSWQGGQTATATPEPNAPTFQQNAQQEMLLNLVRNPNSSIWFFIFALVVSLLLGALHALTPGHGKTVVAAYLVGSRGTVQHAVALGAVVTLTHTGSVFALGLVTLVASRYILPTSIIPVLEIVSGLFIVVFGMYLLWQRLVYWLKTRSQNKVERTERKFSLTPAPKRNLSSAYTIQKIPEHSHHHGDGKMHSHAVPEAITWRSLISLGVSGGLVPCPDAIAILLVAVAINRILLGLALIVSFSLGLAIVLIVIGLLMVSSRRLFDRFDAFNRFAPIMPIVSALMVLALGFVLTFGAYTRAKASFDPSEAAVGQKEAQILYLADDENKVTQLFRTSLNDKNPQKLTAASNGVIDYVASPDGTRVLYILQTDDMQNQMWIVNLQSGDDRKLSDCTDAVCSSPAWSPDGRGVVFEDMSLAANASGLATLAWIDPNTGEIKLVFQDSQLAAANPRWAPDGKWLSYATPDSVRLYNLDTKEDQVISSMLGAPANWSPDAKRILYRDVIIQNNQFVTQLFVYDLASKTKVNISPDLGFENILAAWSPDGQQIAVVRRNLSIPRGDEIWVMNADGSELRQLTNTTAALHGSLNWSADGKNILYDLYQLDSFPLESTLQMVSVASGEITDLGIKGYNPKWLE